MTKATRTNGRNVLEISCKYEEEPPHPTKSATKQKISYLEKIKSKVKNLSGGKSVITSHHNTHNHQSNSNATEKVQPRDELHSPDIGTFTSVTTSGILSYKPTLEDRPTQFGRRNSLTKTHIQNTEYVQGVSRVVVDVTPNPMELENEKIMNSITDSDKLNLLSSSENDEGTSITTTSTSSALKSAVTKNDWIHEWAKSARKSTTEMSRSFTVDSNVHRLVDDDPMSRSACFAGRQNQDGEEYGDNLERNNNEKHSLEKRGTNLHESNFIRASDSPLAQLRYSVRRRYSGDKTQANDLTSVSSSSVNKRPPMSPTKIPSPVHTINRARSMSHNRGNSRGNSAVDLSVGQCQNDTDVYLQNTAAAIMTLQSMHLNNNSMSNSPSPSHPPSSPRRMPPQSPQRTASDGAGGYNIIEECQNKMNRIQQLHKRNLSLDGSERDRNRRDRHGRNNSALGRVQQHQQQPHHTRHHSYEGGRQQNMATIDQTTMDGEMLMMVARQQQQAHLKGHGAPQSSPIRRSSSFSTQKPGGAINGQSNQHHHHQRVQRQVAGGVGGGGGNAIKKSASSTSFKKYHYEDAGDIYINDDDDLDPGRVSNEEDSDGEEDYDDDNARMVVAATPAAPVKTIRCNKALLMRIEQNKAKPVTVSPSVQVALMQKQQGAMACPNTPEMSRRGQALLRQPLRDRQSMPRDSSLNRMKQDQQMTLASTKRVLKETPAKVQPKYLDISKYKPTTTGNFLKKDESKSYLVKGAAAAVATAPLDGIKRSPSSASVTLTRTDPTRMSNRSVKSAGMRPSQKKEAPGGCHLIMESLFKDFPNQIYFFSSCRG